MFCVQLLYNKLVLIVIDMMNKVSFVDVGETIGQLDPERGNQRCTCNV